MIPLRESETVQTFPAPMKKVCLHTFLLVCALAMFAKGADVPPDEIPFEFHDGFNFASGFLRAKR